MKRILLLCFVFLMLCFPAQADDQKKLEICTDGSEIVASLVAGFEAANPDILVKTIQTETVTREMVIKTRIAAGEPVDVAIYWGTRLNSFSDIGMCKDLTPYIDAEWRNALDTNMLINGNDGRIYGIPYNAIFHVLFYNQDMLEAYGFEEPQTWDDLTQIFARLKQDGIYGFCTNSVSMQDSLYGLTYAQLEALGQGHSLAFADGKYSVIDTPEGEAIRSVIELIKSWYDAGYWYPGDNIITSAATANAAFATERCMFVFNSCDELGIHLDMCDFEVNVMPKPVMNEGMDSLENLETKVMFIPDGVSEEQTELALKFLRFATSREGQQIVINAAAVPACNYEMEISELLAKIAGFKQNSITLINPCKFSPAMQNFIKQEIFTTPCLGIRSVDETLLEMERIFAVDQQP